MNLIGKFSFANRTAIVTGAGGGLGRAYALELAKRGCNVIVNDMGGSLSGGGSDGNDPASKVVSEIVNFGGKATADHHNVLESDKIVENAFKAYGSCDILINNAGILRDKTFHKMTEADWMAVMDVHLTGTFRMCHALWPHMQERSYGRIVNIGSASGCYGNFGQSNYSAAKMGILGLSNTLAKEGAKSNIHVNCVVPVAASRMTESLIPPKILDMLEPRHVAPIVAYLSSESCEGTGGVYEVGGGWFSKIRWQRTAGVNLCSDSSPASIEDIADNFDAICDFSDNTTFPSDPSEAIQAMMTTKPVTNGPKTAATPTPVEQVATPVPTARSEASVPPAHLKSSMLFNALQDFCSNDATGAAKLATQIRATVQFHISEGKDCESYIWMLNMNGDSPSVEGRIYTSGASKEKFDVRIRCSDSTLDALSSGKLSPEFAYMKGQLELRGDMPVALRVRHALSAAAKLITT